MKGKEFPRQENLQTSLQTNKVTCSLKARVNYSMVVKLKNLPKENLTGKITNREPKVKTKIDIKLYIFLENSKKKRYTFRCNENWTAKTFFLK
jgi:alpha-L-arabinofuranosidase